jgi:hypothetical protein
MATQAHFQSRIATSIATSNVKKNSICSDEDAKDNLNNQNKKTLLENGSFVNIKVEPVDADDANIIDLSLEEEDSQPGHDVGNQLNLQTAKDHQTTVGNKKFKCVECHFRSNLPRCIKTHFKITHPHVKFSQTQCFQVLDEDEATRTLAAYKKNPRGDRYACKPFKCGKCEYRAAHKSTTYRHLTQVHKLDHFKAKRLLEVMPFDDAEKTVGDYNKKFVCDSGISCAKFWLKTLERR